MMILHREILIADHHCHILSRYYPAPLEVIENLRKNSNLKYIISMGLDYETSKELIEIKKKINLSNPQQNFLRIGVGLHPYEIIQKGHKSFEEFKKIKELIISNLDLIDYIGEIGIDLFYANSQNNKDIQISIFKKFCRLSQKYQKPISVHSRKANHEVIIALKNLAYSKRSNQICKFKGYAHCFSGTLQEGLEFLNLGLKLGISGLIMRPSYATLRKVIHEIIQTLPVHTDINEIIGLESDSPYLPIVPNTTNTPDSVNKIAEFIRSEILKEF